MTLTGVLLAGGKSSRYGKPKMFEQWRHEPLYMVAVHAFDAQNWPLVIATNAALRPHFDVPHATFIVEQQPHEGPLYALAQVMTQVDAAWYFVVAADMPYLNAAFMQMLAAHITADIDAIIPTVNGKWQPLAGLYHRRTLQQATQALAHNRRSMRALLDEVRVQFVAIDDAKLFLNINAAADWPQRDKGDTV